MCQTRFRARFLLRFAILFFHEPAKPRVIAWPSANAAGTLPRVRIAPPGPGNLLTEFHQSNGRVIIIIINYYHKLAVIRIMLYRQSRRFRKLFGKCNLYRRTMKSRSDDAYKIFHLFAVRLPSGGGGAARYQLAPSRLSFDRILSQKFHTV